MELNFLSGASSIDIAGAVVPDRNSTFLGFLSVLKVVHVQSRNQYYDIYARPVLKVAEKLQENH